MSRFLVTGGAGFIGAALCHRLAAAGHELSVLDDLSTGKADRLPTGTQFIKADIRDRIALSEALRGADGVFHLAAVSSVEACTERPRETHRTNVLGTVTLLELSDGRPIVYASSGAVYGEPTDLPITETAATRPLSAYAVDKLASEQHMEQAASLRAARGIALRLFNVYGAGQPSASPYAGVITRFADDAASGRPITIYGDGEQVRDFIHVDDVSVAFEVAMSRAQREAPGFFARFNICTGGPLSITELAAMIGRLTGRSVPNRHLPARKGDVRLSVGDPTRARHDLGFRAAISFEKGLSEILRLQADEV